MRHLERYWTAFMIITMVYVGMKYEHAPRLARAEMVAGTGTVDLLILFLVDAFGSLRRTGRHAAGRRA